MVSYKIYVQPFGTYGTSELNGAVIGGLDDNYRLTVPSNGKQFKLQDGSIQHIGTS